MRLPTDSLIKLLVTQSALKSLVFVMNPAVLNQVLLTGEGLGTDVANEGLLFSVYHYVLGETSLVIELDFTEGT